jgi:hypothetical protein
MRNKWRGLPVRPKNGLPERRAGLPAPRPGVCPGGWEGCRRTMCSWPCLISLLAGENHRQIASTPAGAKISVGYAGQGASALTGIYVLPLIRVRQSSRWYRWPPSSLPKTMSRCAGFLAAALERARPCGHRFR